MVFPGLSKYLLVAFFFQHVFFISLKILELLPLFGKQCGTEINLESVDLGLKINSAVD